ncbi:phosphoglucosamine mutase [Candidatus Fermentibacteria bacterium]|nr:phosphoglucosamine mutase [Candidatus Fermentibacteria bacterium]
MTKPIVSGSGIRGVFGKSFTESDALRYAAAFGNLVGSGAVVVGRDTRSSGPVVEEAVLAGLTSSGCTPLSLGVVPTPTVQLEAMREGVAGGVAVTASHNPSEWNALKLIGTDGVFLRADARKALMEILRERASPGAAHPAPAAVILGGSVERHVETVVNLPSVERDGRKLKVVMDPVGGAATELAVGIMERLEVGYGLINSRMGADGTFPRGPEPVGENLADLCKAVVSEGADLGLAFDPDGDRLALVDEQGRPIGEDLTVALALQLVLAHRPGPVVVNLSTSMVVEDVAGRFGCPVYRSPVGEVNVVEEMEARGAEIGGEGNGGVIDLRCHPGRDSGVAMAYVVSFLRLSPELDLSGWTGTLTGYSMLKRKLPLEKPFENLAPRLEEAFGAADDTRDGLWFRRDRGWIHVRPSGTEPVVRFICEDRDRQVAEERYNKFRKVVYD